MKRSQLTKYVKSKMTNCIVCNTPICEEDNFHLLKTTVGKYTLYTPVHYACAIAKAADMLTRRKKDDIQI